MAKLKLKQVNSNMSYNTSNNILTVSGSLQLRTDNPLEDALDIYGSVFIADNPNVASASISTSGSVNFNILDAGSY